MVAAHVYVVFQLYVHRFDEDHDDVNHVDADRGHVVQDDVHEDCDHEFQGLRKVVVRLASTERKSVLKIKHSFKLT